MSFKKEVLYIDMDGVVADFPKKWKDKYGSELDLYKIPPTPDGFYRDLEVIEGAYESVKILSEFFDVYFLSHSYIYSCVPYWSVAGGVFI
jgi:5'(3')-deoxyribonucleotidase